MVSSNPTVTVIIPLFLQKLTNAVICGNHILLCLDWLFYQAHLPVFVIKEGIQDSR